MELTAFVLSVREPLFELGARPGDEILVRPGDPDPVIVVRRPKHPPYGELAAAIAEGRAESTTLPCAAALASLVRLAASRPEDPSRRARRRWSQQA